MNNKITISFIMLVFLAIGQIAAHDNIPLRPELPSTQSSGGRSLDFIPTAVLDGTELTLSYPLSTESQVIIIDQRTQATVYTETFAATRSLNIDLEEEGLPDGSYTLRIYAFGKWWVGEFVIGEDE